MKKRLLNKSLSPFFAYVAFVRLHHGVTINFEVNDDTGEIFIIYPISELSSSDWSEPSTPIEQIKDARTPIKHCYGRSLEHKKNITFIANTIPVVATVFGGHHFYTPHFLHVAVCDVFDEILTAEQEKIAAMLSDANISSDPFVYSSLQLMASEVCYHQSKAAVLRSNPKIYFAYLCSLASESTPKLLAQQAEASTTQSHWISCLRAVSSTNLLGIFLLADKKSSVEPYPVKTYLILAGLAYGTARAAEHCLTIGLKKCGFK